eukprot:gene3489-2440_t
MHCNKYANKKHRGGNMHQQPTRTTLQPKTSTYHTIKEASRHANHQTYKVKVPSNQSIQKHQTPAYYGITQTQNHHQHALTNSKYNHSRYQKLLPLESRTIITVKTNNLHYQHSNPQQLHQTIKRHIKLSTTTMQL